MSWQRCSTAIVFVLAVVCSAQIQRNQVRIDTYGPGWNGDRYRAGSADAVFDKIQSLILGMDPNYLPFLDLAWYSPAGDPNVDDSATIQLAINDAIAAGKALLIRRASITDPNLVYRIETGLTVPASATAVNFCILGVGQPTLIWAGAPGGSMLSIAGVSYAQIANLTLDGNDIAGVNGIAWRTALGGEPNEGSQRNTIRQTVIRHCAGSGLLLDGDPNTIIEHLSLDAVNITRCGQGINNRKGVRELLLRDTTIQYCDTYGINLVQGMVQMYGGVLASNATSDIYIGGPLARFMLYGTSTQSQVILRTDPNAYVHSDLYAGNLMIGVQQDGNCPAASAYYDANQPLILDGCKFLGDFQIGPNTPAVHARGVQFADGNDFTGFTAVLVEAVPGYKSYSITVDGPGTLTDPNVMMLRLAVGSFPFGMTVAGLGIQTRPAGTYNVTFYDYNAPDDPLPDLLGTCSTSAGTTDVNDIADVTVATGHTLVVQLVSTGAPDQIEAIVWGRPKGR